MSILEEPTN